MDNIKILIFIIGVLTIFISESTTAKSSTRHRVTLKNTVVEDPKLQNASASTGSGSNSTSPGNFTSIGNIIFLSPTLLKAQYCTNTRSNTSSY